jgi:hypothetical protein
MTHEQIRSRIRRDLLELAAHRYPNNPKLQMLFQIGFLQAQLAEAISRDSHAGDRFEYACKQASKQ